MQLQKRTVIVGRKSGRRGRRNRPPMPMAYVPPASKRVNLVFTEGISITESAANTGAFRFFRMNSAYDVDTAVGSTATPGFNEWSSFFLNYRVLRTRVRIEAVCSGVSSGAAAQICMVPNPYQQVLPANATVWPVQPNATSKMALNFSNGGSHNLTVMDRTYSMPALARITKAQFMNDFDYSALISGNPTRQIFLAVTVAGVGSSTVVTLIATVRVSMEVEFFNPTLLSA